MTVKKIKRNFVDMRLAWGLVAPLIALSNFILLFYNFTDLKDKIPFDYFLLGFGVLSVVILIVIGKIFRKNQLSTDINLAYEQSTEHVRTQRIEMEAIKEIANKMQISLPFEFFQRVEYLKKLENGK